MVCETQIMNQDTERLKAFSHRRDEEAFREIVETYAGMVFATARRRVGNAETAEEVAQTTFTILARKAERVATHPCLAAWLHRTAVNEASKRVRSEHRHLRKVMALTAEQSMLQSTNGNGENTWSAQLDEAIQALPAKDQQLVMLRYFEELSFKEIARVIEKTEGACHKQMARALDKLGRFLRRRGTMVSSTAIGAAMSGQLSEAAPEDLVAALANKALNISAEPLSFLTITRVFSPSKLATVLGVVCVIGGSLVLIWKSSLPTHAGYPPNITPSAFPNAVQGTNLGKSESLSARPSLSEEVGPTAAEVLEAIWNDVGGGWSGKHPKVRAYFPELNGFSPKELFAVCAGRKDVRKRSYSSWVIASLDGREPQASLAFLTKIELDKELTSNLVRQVVIGWSRRATEDALEWYLDAELSGDSLLGSLEARDRLAASLGKSLGSAGQTSSALRVAAILSGKRRSKLLGGIVNRIMEDEELEELLTIATKQLNDKLLLAELNQKVATRMETVRSRRARRENTKTIPPESDSIAGSLDRWGYFWSRHGRDHPETRKSHEKLAKVSPEDVFKACREIEKPDKRKRLADFAVNLLGKEHPRRCLAFVAGEEVSRQANLVRAVLIYWVKSAPDAAVAWFLDRHREESALVGGGNDRTFDALVAQVISKLPQGNRLAFASQLIGEARQRVAIRQILIEFDESMLEREGNSILQEMGDAAFRALLANEMAVTLAESDLNTAKDWADDLQGVGARCVDAAHAGVARQWLGSNGAEAADWWLAKRGGAPVAEVYEAIVRVWAPLSPNDCGKWLGSQPSGSVLDGARAAFARAIAERDRDSAEVWANAIEARELRQKVLETVVGE